jgi:hypothetical protein
MRISGNWTWGAEIGSQRLTPERWHYTNWAIPVSISQLTTSDVYRYRVTILEVELTCATSAPLRNGNANKQRYNLRAKNKTLLILIVVFWVTNPEIMNVVTGVSQYHAVSSFSILFPKYEGSSFNRIVGNHLHDYNLNLHRLENLISWMFPFSNPMWGKMFWIPWFALDSATEMINVQDY